MYIPPFDLLKSENKEDILKVIKQTKIKMEKLRRKMEHPDYLLNVFVAPSDDVIYNCDRDFLDQAISRYLLLGGSQEEIKEELSDRLFNEKLKDITKISFNKGCFCSCRTTFIIDLTGEKPVMGFDNCAEKPFDFKKERFLGELESLHIGEWNKTYKPEDFGLSVLDGEEWSLEFEYKSGEKVIFSGHEAYPYNFDELLSLLEG